MVQVNADNWNIPPNEIDKMMSLLGDFNAAYEANDIAKTKNQLTAKAEELAREALTEQVRHIKRAYIEFGLETKIISKIQYMELGFELHDNENTQHGKPKDLVAFVLSMIIAAHKLIAKFHIEGSEHRGKGPYHAAEIRIWVLPQDAPAPVDAKSTGWSSFVATASPWEYTFSGDEIGKRLYIAMRWENASVGEDENGKGPWSAIQSMVIA
jgi:hypothetical protein